MESEKKKKKNGDSTRVEKHAMAKGVPLLIIHDSVKTGNSDSTSSSSMKRTRDTEC